VASEVETVVQRERTEAVRAVEREGKAEAAGTVAEDPRPVGHVEAVTAAAGTVAGTVEAATVEASEEGTSARTSLRDSCYHRRELNQESCLA
jgi:hypothetical protein